MKKLLKRIVKVQDSEHPYPVAVCSNCKELRPFSYMPFEAGGFEKFETKIYCLGCHFPFLQSNLRIQGYVSGSTLEESEWSYEL
jgi:hypothetical protein